MRWNENGEKQVKPRVRRGLLWFFVYNVIALGAMGAIYLLVYYGVFLDPVFQATYRHFQKHQVQAVLAEAMPFFASLLVGIGYARRAARRRANGATTAAPPS